MGKFDKQLKYSIRKVSVGAASVVIGAFYLAMGAGVVHAETNTTTDGGASHSSPSPEPETSKPNSLTASNYGAEPAQNPGVSGKSTESTTPKEKENKETLNAAQPTEASTSANTRGRRVRREAGDAPAGGISNTPTGTETPAGSSTGNNEVLDSAVTERKGSTVQPDQPGISIPKGNEDGAHDPNAHLKFDAPKEDATVEEMWKIIQHMPDDFQNNERSYLRNMDTLGRELRFDKTAENPEGVPLQPGEIRELHDFGGWHAIDKNGTSGKFVIGRKNEQGYFTGWHKVGETPEGIPIVEQGGMLGADALDNVYVHEQALDRRFDYMLMLVKGRTRANRTETVADNSTYDPHAPSERANMSEAAFNKLPFLEKDKFNKYSPAVVGYNGIEKKFTAFSTKYGSRVRVDFVTGYISDINGSKGSYRIVIKAQNSKGEETKVYDETISRVAEIVQNEDLYKKGLNVEATNSNILKFLRDEFHYRINKIRNEKVKNSSLKGINKKDYDSKQQELYDQFEAEATEEAKKQGDIVMNVTEDFLSIAKSKKKDSEWKKAFTSTAQLPIKLANDLNTLLKNVITPGEPNSPTWAKSSDAASQADDKAYKLLTALIPGAKKITYHVNDDQLEVETDKYTYTAARNGSTEVGIQGSDIVATDPAASYNFPSDKFATINSNTTVNNNSGGWAKSSNEGYGEFSNLIGQDHGIRRTNVLTDKELSDKIIEKLGPGNKKLGRAGYFSTADIPLGTDIVSYTVQVIPSDDGRVGVNTQSSRIQYNMPILADFSVIQDTTGPSKEVAKRIITKLKEQGKITGDQEKKIKEEIDKAKKTSEVRSAMSGDVIVRYVDTDGNNLPITDADAKKAGEKTDNGYLVRKDVLIGTDYDVNSKKVPSFNATNGKNYALRSVGGGLETSSDALSGSITKKKTVITFVYEERTVPPTGKGVVHFKKQVTETTTEALTGYDDITLEGNVGDTFSSTDVDTRITALKNAGYEIVTNEFDTNSKTIDSTTDVDGQDPSQVYNVIVREKVEIVTTPPTPNTPVDPNIPEGPKWPAEGLKESDLKKEVTRTINYFKKETADGEKIPDAQPTKVDKVLYKRTATYNLVSKTVTYSGWTATADATHTDTSFSPVKTPVLDGYVANIKEVTDAPAAPNANGEVTNMTREVVYTKLGSWVPKIPGKDSTPIPYPNDPKDPTKPKYPDYPKTPENPGETPNPQPDNPGSETPGTPEKPKTPVIPYVEGYVPKIPTDPTTPVGEDNPLKPLVPIDSNDPKKGYKVPELPNDPKKDTVIEYKPNPQKILIKVVNVTTGEEVELPNEKLEFNGVSDQVVTSEDKGKVDKKIDSLQKRGYIVSTKNPITETTKYDTKDDSNQKEPTQTYKIIVNEPVTKDTEVRKVTRTIKYVKIDVQDGNEVRTELNTEKIKTKVDKVEFSRDTTTSLATGLTKIGAWDQETKELPKVNTPVLVGYIANVASVENKSVSPDTESYEVTVEYRKIGSWVPNLPEGVTPPAGTDMTPKPYPNNPTDPTKPKDPEYPQPGTPVEPNTPVIPYVPGYTPKIPTDPTQPVDPNTNPLVPLTPVDPNHPENGYKVPPVPTTPGNDTPITYEANPQKALVKVVKVDGTTETPLTEDNVAIAGKTGEKIPTGTVTAKIADLEKRGYVVDNKQEVLTAIGKNPFDTDKDTDGEDPTQTFTLKVHEKVVEVTEPPTPNTPIDPENPNGPKWTEELVNQLSLKKDVTRTITYVKKDTPNGEEIPNAKPTVTQTAHFKRNVKVNVATGTVVEYTAWTSTDNNLAAVTTEKLDGYVADKASVERVETSVDSTDLDKKVVYTKLGSWVPNLPEGVKPPAGTDMTPKPYPNNPTDPTKPGTPVYPEPGQPITPGTPVIPYVPGYTPKIGETPLQPVDPNNPGNGYKVPPVPTEPGTNTDITYVADPQKAVVKVFNTTTGTEVELPAEKVSIDNGTTDAAIPTTDLNTKIADLEKRGYVVENKDLLKDQKFDKEKDPTDGDPTQVFKLLVKERTVTVTEPPTPNTPVDPNVPEGPKWPESGLKESDLKKEVTRTITYVKKETANGPEIADAKPTVTQTAHFKRSATYNAVTGTITYGNWESADKELAKVDTPELTGYVADKASVDKVETNADSTGLDQKVVYTKLGSWVPNLPEGVTPPEGTDMTPKPYPNNPTDPTRPGEPEYPQPGTPVEPNTPVIPYVPGYTPKTPNGNPLEPVDPNHPENGYKVPPVPTTPGNDTPITYEADTQKAIVKYVVEGITTVLHTEELTGDSGTTINYTTANKLAELKVLGYELVTDGFTTATDKNFDKDKTVDQTFEVIVKPKVVDVPPFEPTNPKGDDNPKPEPGQPIDPENPNGPKWTKELIGKLATTKHVTRTITYVEDGTDKEVANKATDKVTFTRSLKVNVVTGDVVDPNVAWTSNDTTFDEVTSPVVKGYILKANQDAQNGLVSTDGTSVVASTNLTETSENQNVKVAYIKLGSWIPNEPGKDKPTPIPYPNNPTDPTKPGEPTDPNVPVIPYVPGYTPKIGETPLVPKVPTDPTQGYIPPKVPTTPGEDTPITYEGNPQKALVKVVKVEGEGDKKIETPLPKDNVTINGKTGDQIPTESVTAKIAELEKRGYVIDNRDEVVNYINNKFDKDNDTEGQDPTQTVTLKVHEKLVPVTPPTPEKPLEPGKPIDPDVPVDPNTPVDPKTPVWTEELINKVKNAKTTKEVTRTINYVDESGIKLPYTDKGKETTESKTDKVTFTREAKINVVTGEITYGEWTAKDNDTTFEAVTSPVVKGYILKANQGSEDGLVSTDGTRVAASTNLTAASENQNLNVVYTKLGSWVLTPPTGVTPPEGTNFDPKPYPNNPTDPTRPGEPEYPQPGTPVEPNTPVIPYVPGYTPKTPNGNPLEPVDPNHPENGYKVPPVPTTPGNDTPITYEADTQKAIVKYVVEGTTTVLHTEELTGDSGTTINYTTANKLAELKVLGYELVTDGFTTETGRNFDKDKTVDQTFEVTVKPKVVDVPPFEPTNPQGDDNPKPEPGQPIDPENPNGPKWTKELIDKLVTTKHVTRTITYVEDGTDKEVANKATDKVTFTRSLKVNVVTGDVVDPNVAWTSNDTTFDEVTSPVVKGYVLKANQGSEDGLVTVGGTRVVASTNLTAASENQNLNVVYTKLGSWVLTPPTGVTPPEGTNFDPKPYPNNPTDPTRPKDPEYPQPGTPVEPNTPVIPYVPGYTPKTPNGNPLVPVDPNNPESGYKVPPVPTTPGNDTPITYEGNPQKVLVKVVKVDGTTETPLPKDNVTINGKTGDQIPTESVTAKIAELEKRGYVIDNRDEVVNYINNKFDKEKDTEGQDPTQNTTLKVHEKLVPVTPPTDDKPLEPGQPIDPDTPVDPNNPNDPTIPRWTDELIKKLDVKKEVTRTINYVDEAGNKVSEPSTDKVTFTREAKINVVTGEITYGDWKAVGGDTTFDKVSSPVVKGYILKDPAQKEVAERKGITPTVANQTIEVVYKKLGSWVPKVPGVETPTPLPYPNNPTDPTKPGEPTDPNVPVIPYVPGYTPKTPDGNPLVPVNPNHPENGYKVPPVPTEPGQDTPIEYVKVPNTPSPEEPVKPTPESNHITIWVDENGKPLKPEKPGTHEPGNIPGYRYITTVTKDGVTIHRFEKITPVEPNNHVPQKPATPIPTPQDPTIPTPESQIPIPNTPEENTPTSETNRREELPNTGTEANAGLASAGIMTLLAGLGLGFFKKKEEDESE